MFDLWLSLTIHLFSLYEKRKAELLADSSSKIAGKAHATAIRENWTHFSTSPIRSTTSTAVPAFFSLRPINFSARNGSNVFSQVAASTPPRRSEPSHSHTMDGDDEKDAKNSGTERVVGGAALSPKPPTVGNTARSGKGVVVPTEINVGMMHHTLSQPSPRSSRVYRIARSPVDADRFQTIEQIVAKTQEILAMSASKARERKSVNGVGVDGVGVDGQVQNTIVLAKGPEGEGRLAFGVVESSTLNKYRYKNRSELEKAEEMLRNEEHNRLPPLVQKVGLSLLERERTIADINEGNRKFLQSVTSVSSSGRGGSSERITALRVESDTNASLQSERLRTSEQESRDTKNDLVRANEVCSTEDRKEMKDFPLSHRQLDSRWDKIKSDVATELEALFDRKYMINQYRGSRSGNNSSARAGPHWGNELNSNFDTAKRSAAAPGVDFEAAKERSRNAGKVADQTVEANKVFEALVVTRERERLERLRSCVDN